MIEQINVVVIFGIYIFVFPTVENLSIIVVLERSGHRLKLNEKTIRSHSSRIYLFLIYLLGCYGASYNNTLKKKFHHHNHQHPPTHIYTYYSWAQGFRNERA